ncbi:thioredoxin domain-containing protein [Marivirga harenae]|uniref:thioredoxin domain-containing protein n=1 Tax=Marivirga harenae TaxID=2010992 RepID=UPI0026DFCF88|nr:thioredoxin domain-containing protein [Marivirga harenae]WKV11215.1 thioredoxin domain-containing protein [Marivirga harenae]
MKKFSTLFITLIICISSTSYSQVSWLNNEKIAKAIATEKDQLILMDFWATWCGPCRKMDSDMWNTEEFKALSENFVPLKIDIDREKELARSYNVRSIPHVVLVTASGEIVWEQTGYSHSAPYEKILKNLPESLNGINTKLLTLSEDFNDEAYFSIGDSYLELAMENSEDLKRGFFALSDNYYKEITKNSDSNENIALAEMKMLLNDAYLGRYNRAVRKVDKIEINQNEELADMKQFIKAYCFKCEGDKKAFEEAKSLITSEEYLSQLEE